MDGLSQLSSGTIASWSGDFQEAMTLASSVPRPQTKKRDRPREAALRGTDAEVTAECTDLKLVSANCKSKIDRA